MDINKEVASGDSDTFCEDKNGIWRFPSCLVQDSPCIKEEVKDEITVEEGGVHCKIEEESRTHSQNQYAISNWPIKVEFDEDFISHETVYVEEMEDISVGSYIEQERDPISTECGVPVDHQILYMNQNNTSDSFVDKYEEMSTCTRKCVKARKVYVCKFCNKTFTYPSDLDVHTRIFHTECRSLDYEVKLKKASEQGKVYECKVCSKQIYGLFRNLRHCKTHAEPYSAQKIRCKSCGESSSQGYVSKVCCRSGRDMSNIDPQLRDLYFF